jgi:hypothetical protein
MAENPTDTPATAAPAAAATADGSGVGNPRDVQGILALVVVGGTFAIAAVAIVLGTSAATVLAAVLPLSGTIIGFYYGQKSQQT